MGRRSKTVYMEQQSRETTQVSPTKTFCFNICFHLGHDMHEGSRKSCKKDLVRTWPFQVEAHDSRATLNVLSTLPHARSCVCMSVEGMSGYGA